MTDQPRYPDTGPGTGRREGMPRWLKILLITVAVAVLLVIVGMFLLGGDDEGHSPGRHGLPATAPAESGAA